MYDETRRSGRTVRGAGSREQAPAAVNLVEFVVGLMLTHDALHPGEPLYLREVLAALWVEADHSTYTSK